MARQIPTQPITGARCVGKCLDERSRIGCEAVGAPPLRQQKRPALLGLRSNHWGDITLLLLFILPITGAQAETTASRNKEGNRLFAEKKYAEAEKAYLDAQVKSPGTPEVLYNLGNSLIKQNKIDPGIQALKQSMDAGKKEIKTNSWYNTGNALFAKGNFQEAAKAYIQALQLNPADKDAKHNLELSLLKLQQQKQQQNNQQQKPQNSGNKNQAQAAQKKDGNNTENRNAPKPSQGEQPRETPKQQPGNISKEQAQQILDAFQNRELEDQRKLRERRSGQKANERDW